MPYIVKVYQDEVQEEAVDLPAINQSKKDGKLYSTFELPHSQKVNRLDLAFRESDFNGYVTLQGSADQREWFDIEKNQRIASIIKDGTQLTATYINFPLVNYRYLRVSITADKALDFPTASFRKQQTKAGRMHDIPLHQKEEQNKAAHQTVTTIHFSDLQKASQISLSIEGTDDYYRSFQLEQLKDSTKTPKGWEYYYEPVYSGLLTSFNKNTFPINAFTRTLRLTVYNGDSPALRIQAIHITGPDIELIAKVSTGQNYLYYGSNIAAPAYDLEHFTEKIPASLIALSVGEEEKITADAPAVAPLIQSKIWLWLIMAIVIALLGFFTLRMMKSK